jgi:hypothetical protein
MEHRRRWETLEKVERRNTKGSLEPHHSSTKYEFTISLFQLSKVGITAIWASILASLVT